MSAALYLVALIGVLSFFAMLSIHRKQKFGLAGLISGVSLRKASTTVSRDADAAPRSSTTSVSSASALSVSAASSKEPGAAVLGTAQKRSREHEIFMNKWVSSFTNTIKDASLEFASFEDSPNLRYHLEQAFKAKATTLSSYWYGWHKWLTHCSRAGIHPGKPEGCQLADFLFAVLHEYDTRPNGKTVSTLR